MSVLGWCDESGAWWQAGSLKCLPYIEKRGQTDRRVPVGCHCHAKAALQVFESVAAREKYLYKPGNTFVVANGFSSRTPLAFQRPTVEHQHDAVQLGWAADIRFFGTTHHQHILFRGPRKLHQLLGGRVNVALPFAALKTSRQTRMLPAHVASATVDSCNLFEASSFCGPAMRVRGCCCPRRRRNRHLGQRRGRLKFACFRSQRSLPSFGPLIYGLANLRQSFGIMPTMWFSLLLESGTINSGGWSKATISIKRISVSQLGLWQIWMPKRVLIWQHKLGPSLNCKVSSPAMDLATDPFALCASKMKLSVFGICFFTWWRVHRLIGDLLDRADVTKKIHVGSNLPNAAAILPWISAAWKLQRPRDIWGQGQKTRSWKFDTCQLPVVLSLFVFQFVVQLWDLSSIFLCKRFLTLVLSLSEMRLPHFFWLLDLDKQRLWRDTCQNLCFDCFAHILLFESMNCHGRVRTCYQKHGDDGLVSSHL